MRRGLQGCLGWRVSDRLSEVAAGFGHLLHQTGLPVTPERSVRFATAVELVEPDNLKQLYWIGRVTFLTSRDQVQMYDRVFSQVFKGIVDIADFRGDSANPPPPSSSPGGEREEGDPRRSGETPSNPHGTSATPGTKENEDSEEEASVLAAMSQEERLSQQEFSLLTEAELGLIRRLIERLPVVPPLRRARRTRRDRQGQEWDVRATLRRSYRTGGDPVQLAHRSRTTKARRVILIADVSGSMEPYARVYLHLMRGAVIALKAEAFVFATRLTRLTRALGSAQPDLAYRKVAETAQDWSGGTRIGRALKDFIDGYGRRGLARGAVIVIVSDGWEIEDPALVAESMARLSRLAHHIIWVNPRKAADAYEPRVGGMAAALPYIDTFLSGHSVRALEDVLAAIAAAQVRPDRSNRAAA